MHLRSDINEENCCQHPIVHLDWANAGDKSLGFRKDLLRRDCHHLMGIAREFNETGPGNPICHVARTLACSDRIARSIHNQCRNLDCTQDWADVDLVVHSLIGGGCRRASSGPAVADEQLDKRIVGIWAKACASATEIPFGWPVAFQKRSAEPYRRRPLSRAVRA
jgi:hypothetical protein